MLSNILDRISFWALFVVIVFLPVFFLPFTKIPIETSKGLLLIIGLAISIIFWTGARFFDGKVVLPKSKIILGGFCVVLAFLLSAVFSSASKVSFFGTMFDMGTFWFIFAGFLLMFISSILLKEPKNAKMVLFGSILSSAFVLIFQVFHLFMPSLLSLGILGGKTDNILGSWNAFGLFAGFLAVTSIFVIEFFSISKSIKWIFSLFLLLSIFSVVVVNFPLIWVILGIFSLVVFVYKVSFSSGSTKKTEENVHFPTASFVVLMISLLFFMSGQFIGGFLPNRLNISNVEVSPSFSATLSVTGQALKDHPVFGMGPNRFGEVWAMYKPSIINTTQFWDTYFNSGSGLLPTFVSTTGYLGLLALLYFFFIFISSGIKTLFSSIKNGLNWDIATFFVISIYLFVSAFFYSTGPVLFLMAFAFVGVFVGLSSHVHPNGVMTISFLDDPRKSFFSILFLVFIMIASASLGFKYVERFASVPYYGDALSASSIPIAESSVINAVSLYSNDLYLRTYAQVYLAKLNALIAKGSALSDTEKTDLQSNFDKALNGAGLAVIYDGDNYINYQMLGFVYRSVAPLGVTGAYDKAIEAYKKASDLNPLNPGLKLEIARTFFADNKSKDAEDYAKKALTLKSDYVDALIVLSQIAKNGGNNASAISYAENALSISPSNKDLINYVNTLKNGGSPKVPDVTTMPDNTKKTTIKKIR